MTVEPPFICPRCGAVSHHPIDAAQGYCGRCNEYTAAPRTFAETRRLIAYWQNLTAAERMTLEARAPDE